MGNHGDQDFSKLVPTSWPSSCPSKYEENILSVVCGNTHLHWALHDGLHKEYMPQLFWRTPALNNDEISSCEPCDVLQRYIPSGTVQELIFGKEDGTFDKEQAAKTAAERRIPALGIYVVSTNRENEAGIEFLFRDLPCRMHSMKATDFYSVEQGVYEGMGIDRLANLKAAHIFYQAPVMVIDGGTALTYTALDKNGKIVGGGIAPGLASTLRAMHDFTGALPLIGQQDVDAALEEIKATKNPLSVFAKDTKKAMIVSSLTGLAKVCWCAVKEFKETIVSALGPDGVETEDDAQGTVCVTGGDGDVISELLEEQHSNIIPVESGTTYSREGISFEKHKHLAHYGIAALLKEKSAEGEEEETEEDKIRAEIVGQRVAKKFKIQAKETIYRGAVAAVTPGTCLEDDWFYIRYEDGDTEHLSLSGLYDSLLLYNEVGEDPEASTAKLEVKRKQATDTAKMLVEKSAEIKKHSETPVSERKAGRKRSSGSVKGAPASKSSKTSVSPKQKTKDDPKTYVGQRVAKYFANDVFFGTIQTHIPPATPQDDDLWHVLYDDSDQEDYDTKDLRKGLAVYKKHRAEDSKSKVTAVAEAAPQDE